jgi:hypothetical protein
MTFPTRRAALALALAAILAAAWFAPLDAAATRQTEAGLKRALATFAAARALNAVISVAQGTEVAVEPAGVGVTFAPGQVLDPINDLIEQFSMLMLAASVSFGLQRAVIGIGGYWAVSLALSAAAIAWVWLRWRDARIPRWLTRALLVMLLVRFGVPLVAVGSETVFQVFLADQYAAGQARIELTAEQIAAKAAPPTGPAPDESLSQRLQRWWSSATQGIDVAKRFEELKEAVSRTVEYIITLIVVFLLQTLVVPLLLLWVLIRIGRALDLTFGGGR